MYENLIITCRIDLWGPTPGGGGGTPLYKPYRYVPPQRVGFLCRFSLKTCIVNVWTYLSFQFQMNKKKSNMRIRKGFFEI